MPVIRRNHGGGCCGVSHIIGFHSSGERDAADVRRLISSKAPTKHLYEVVLTEHQLRGEDGRQRMQALKDKNFRLVSKFRNSNSGNICFVFHRCRQVKVELEGWED